MPTNSGHTRAIRTKKVIGTSVKNAAGEQLGQVEDIVLDKLSNDIMFAIVGFGGMMGMGEKYHPLPWASLDFDENDDCYVVTASKEQLQSAPSDTLDALTRDDGMAFRDRTYAHYNAQPYW
jgi:sporulation protein YlmC with PRC-barrel domain